MSGLKRRGRISGLASFANLPPPPVIPEALPSLSGREQLLARRNQQLENRVQETEQRLRIVLERLDALESHTKLEKHSFRLSKVDIGILGYLRLTEYSPLERKFSVSQSSAELYSIVDPECENYYGSPDKGDAWVQFEFKHDITFFGFIIQSYLSCFTKSYRIVSINSDLSEQVLYATSAETGLQGELKIVTRDFRPPVKTRILRFEQTGKSWSEKNFIGIKRLDFRTDQCEGYYLEHLMRLSERDAHKIPVNVTSKYFDPYAFVLQNPKSYVCTFDAPAPSWFQIELLYGRALVTGYRLRRHDALKMKDWCLKASNDVTVPIDDWQVLHSVSEQAEGDSFLVFDIDGKSPFKYFRLVMNGPGWNGRTYLAFWHLELFGDYFVERVPSVWIG
jgi:hypothetical protein